MSKSSLKFLWQSLKHRYPNHLILIQVGAFFEVYENDAVYFEKEFGLRKYQRGGFSVVGFPVIALEKYILEIKDTQSYVVVSESGWDGDRKRREVTREQTIYNEPPQIEDEILSPDNLIPGFLLEKKITSLFHFTHLSNLDSILRHGLKTKKRLMESEIPYQSSDPDRLDGIIDSISVSISTPNYWLLSRKLFEFNQEIAVLELDVSTLIQYPFIAFPSNAARSDLKKLREVEPNEFEGLEALKNLFLNNQLRTDKSIPPHEPTDIQSEIMILHDLPPSQIKSIHIHPCKLEDIAKDSIYFPLLNLIEPLLHLKCDCAFFAPRSNERHDGRRFHFGWRELHGN